MKAETMAAYNQWRKLANQVDMRQRVFNPITEERKQNRIRAAMVKYEKLLAAEQGKPYYPDYS